VEQYEIATVTAVGKRGTQAYLAMEAPAGATNIQVTSLSDISVGDKVRLDIDSVGHGIETVTVTYVGTAASQTNLSAPASAGATRIRKSTQRNSSWPGESALHTKAEYICADLSIDPSLFPCSQTADHTLREFHAYSPAAASIQKDKVPNVQIKACQRMELFLHAPPTANSIPASDNIVPHP
jgi:hypothetical protein